MRSICMPGPFRGQKTLDLPELEVKVVMNLGAGAGNQAQVLGENTKCSWRCAILQLRPRYTPNMTMDTRPGLGCISRQPMRKTEYKLPLGMRPIPHWSSEIPPCFKITLVYLYISVLFYFKNAFPLCFDSLGQSCSLGCTNRLFNQNQGEKKIHVSISLYISASFFFFFFFRKINIC